MVLFHFGSPPHSGGFLEALCLDGLQESIAFGDEKLISNACRAPSLRDWQIFAKVSSLVIVYSILSSELTFKRFYLLPPPYLSLAAAPTYSAAVLGEIHHDEKFSKVSSTAILQW